MRWSCWRAIAFLETQQRFAQQLSGEVEHARVRVDGQRLGADTGAAAERLQARRVVVRRRGRRRRQTERCGGDDWLHRLFLLLFGRGLGEPRDAPRHRLGIDVEFGSGRGFLLQVLRVMQRARARRDGLAECVDGLELVARIVAAGFEQILEAQGSAEIARGARRRLLVEPVDCVAYNALSSSVKSVAESICTCTWYSPMRMMSPDFSSCGFWPPSGLSMSLTKVPLLLVSCSRKRPLWKTMRACRPDTYRMSSGNTQSFSAERPMLPPETPKTNVLLSPNRWR